MRAILVRMPAFAMLLVLFLALVFLTGCGGGGDDGGDDGNGDSGGDENPEAVVFRLNTDLDSLSDRFRLFAGISTGGPTINLSPMTNPNGSVGEQFQLSPNKKWVAYLANAETNDVVELYVSSLDGSVVAQKLSPGLTGNTARYIDNIVWSPDSTQVAYVADQEIALTWELYVSSLNGAIGVKVSADPQIGREGNTDVIRRGDTDDHSSDVVQWAPDGSRLAYIADLDDNQVFELFTTTPDGNGNVVKISNSGPIITDVNSGDPVNSGVPWTSKWGSFAWAPDSSKIAYRALVKYDRKGIHKLYVANPATGEGTVNASSDGVSEFAWAPNSSRIAYTINRYYDSNNSVYVYDNVGLYTMQPDGQAITKVSGTPGRADPLFYYFAWAPNSSRLAFMAWQNDVVTTELFTTTPDTADNVTVVSGASTHWGIPDGVRSLSFFWSPDSNYIAYLSNQETNDFFELYASKADGSSNVKLSGSINNGKLTTGVLKFAWSPDSSHVAYISDQNNEQVYELFTSPIAGARETTESDGGGPASNPRLNPELVTNGGVRLNDTTNFPAATDSDLEAKYLQWSEDSQRVFYYADQEIDELVEFYSATRGGSDKNVNISAPVITSFANYIYPQLSACSSCHETGNTYDWYAASASDTYDNMSGRGYFDNNFIVEKLDGTRSHGNGPYYKLASLFSRWIDEGANNN